MVPIEIISSETLIETRDAFWFFFYNAAGQNSPSLGQITRDNLIAFVEDLTGVKGLSTPEVFSQGEYKKLLQEVDKKLNDLLIEKFKQENIKREIPRPSQTTPRNLTALVEVFDAYLDKRNEAKIREKAEKQQVDWINKQKIYLQAKGDRESLLLDKNDIANLKLLKTSPNDILSKLANEKNLNLLSKKYDPDSLRAFGPNLAMDLEQKMLLQKELFKDGQQFYLPFNKASMINFVSAGLGTQEAMDFAAAYSTLQAMNYDVVATFYGDRVAKVLYGSKRFQDFEEIIGPSKNGATVDLFSYKNVVSGFSRERIERQEFLDRLLGSSTTYIQNDFRKMSSLVRETKIDTGKVVASSLPSTLYGLPSYLGVNPQLFSYARAISLLGQDTQILFAVNGVSVQLTAQLSAAWVLEAQLFPTLSIGITPAITAATGVLTGTTVVEVATVVTAAETTGAALTAAGVTGAIASVVGAVGTPIAGIATALVATKVLPWIKKNTGILAGGFIVGGILVGSTVGLVSVGTGLLLGFGSGSFVAIGSSILSALPALIAGLAGTILGALAGPLVIAIVTIPVLVALIFFIINAGAYVTPQGGGVAANPNSNATLCLPSDGKIAQLPYCQSGDPTFSHCTLNENAYDIGNSKGTSVYAATSGTVTYYQYPVDADNGGYGYYAIVVGNGYKTYYGHMIYGSGMPVGSSKTVKAGDQIGLMDSTGNSTGSHVHFEMREPAGNIADIFGNAVMSQQVQNLNNFPECLTK